MADRTRYVHRRWFGILLGALLAGFLVTAVAPPTRAQGFGWFGGILGGGTPERSPAQPAYPGYRSGGGGYFGGSSGEGYRQPRADDDDRASRRRAQRRKRVVAPTQDTAAAPQKPAAKSTPAVSVDVLGDTFGLLLANGLDDAIADRPDVAIVRKARGPSGLANTAYYDWPKAVDDLLKSEKGKSEKKAGSEGETTKPDGAKGESSKADASKKQDKKDEKADDKKREAIDVAVMMIGSNDRQPITQDGKTYQRGTDEWNAIYRKRVMAIAEAFQKKKVPLIWVGLPITKDDDFADDMAVLNEIFKDVALKTGATYVDSWEVFSDDKGEFSASGPDVNGQTVRLRTPDGIFFTLAGARKLAHFVETHLRRDIDGKVSPPQLPTAETPAPGKAGGTAKETAKAGEKATGGKAPSVAVVKPEAGPIRNLSDAPSAKDGLLMQIPASATDAAAAAALADTVPRNRADNFRWPEEPKAEPSGKPQAPAGK